MPVCMCFRYSSVLSMGIMIHANKSNYKPMRMSGCDVALRIFEATGNSFVVGSISMLLSNVLRREGCK